MRFTNQGAVKTASKEQPAMATTNNGLGKLGVALWTVQGLLALTFLVAGTSKFAMSAEEMTQQIDLPIAFLRFIGVCELLGALGLILPGVLRIHRWLTPLAAAGLVIIMIGATALTLAIGGVAAASMPFTVGVLAAFVAYGRAPRTVRRASRRPTLKAAA